MVAVLPEFTSAMRSHPNTTLRLFRRHLQVPVSALLLALFPLWSVQVKGATLYWDADASATGNVTTGTNLGGTGTWNTGTANWWDGVAVSDQAWLNAGAPGDTAIFTGTAGTVTTGSLLNVNNLLFNTSGYTLTGNSTNTITLLGGTPGVTLGTGVSLATVNAVLAGAGGLTFNGGASSGTLFLNGANLNTYTGTTTIDSGTLRIGSLTALGEMLMAPR